MLATDWSRVIICPGCWRLIGLSDNDDVSTATGNSSRHIHIRCALQFTTTLTYLTGVATWGNIREGLVYSREALAKNIFSIK